MKTVPFFSRLFATALVSMVWAHALAALLVNLSATTVAPAVWAWPVTLGALAVAISAALTSRRTLRLWPALGAGLVAALALGLARPDAARVALAPLLLAPGAALLSAAVGRRLPVEREASAGLGRVRTWLWVGSVLLCLLQFARLGTWMSDGESDWFLTTRNPFWAKHECLSAYVYGAELGLRGDDNVYDPAHYPGLAPEAKPDTAMTNMVVEDPYQYAPPFLLLPAAAVTLTHDYPAVRSVWFALQSTAFFAFAALFALWIGGRVGRVALWLLPLTLSAFPVLHNFQYGQFHLAAIGLALAAMVAFERQRPAAGGAMMAVATLSKIFPGVLLLVLAAQRRFRELAWTAGFAVLLLLGTWAVFGSAPIEAFVSYHLPRLQSGAAFAFGDAWPELREFLLAANHGVYGVVLKLAETGVAGLDADVATKINRVYAVLVALGALYVGTRAARFDRAQSAVVWLSLVGLASMMSTGAFADYVPVAATWLMTLLATRMTDPWRAWVLGGIWFSQYTLLFVAPIGSWFDPSVFMPLSTVSTLLMLGLLVWSVVAQVREARGQEVREPKSLEGGTVPARWSQV